MKKLVALILILTVLTAVAQAAELGVQLITPETNMTAETVSLDDIKLNASVSVYGFGSIMPTAYSVQNNLVKYRKGSNSTDTINSGHEADFVILKMDITNTTATPKNYLADAEVKVVFDDTFEFIGWCYQYNWDRSNGDTKYSSNYVLSTEDNFNINPWYMGHFCFGCTLPNTVIESKAPLRLEIKIGGNEITYNIRK